MSQLQVQSDGGKGTLQLDLTKEEDMKTLRRLYARYPGCWQGVPDEIKKACMRQLSEAIADVDVLAEKRMEKNEAGETVPIGLSELIDRRMSIVKTVAVIVGQEQKDMHKLMDAVVGTAKSNATNVTVNTQVNNVTNPVHAARAAIADMIREGKASDLARIVE